MAVRRTGRALAVICAIVLATSLGACSFDTGDSQPDQSATVTQLPPAGPLTPAELAESMGVSDPPQVVPIREISPVESEEIYSQCLEQSGWGLTRPTEGGDPYFDIPPDQQDAYQLSRYICILEYPVAERFTVELSADQLGILYDYWVEQTVPCFADLGYDVGEVPSRETFLADPAWNPAVAIQDQVGPDVRAGRWESYDHVLYQVCPGPSDDLLYGSEQR